jgi:hypothetical protein
MKINVVKVKKYYQIMIYVLNNIVLTYQRILRISPDKVNHLLN